MTKEDKIKLLELTREKEERKKKRVALDTFNNLYDWQHRFNSATKKFRACMLMAANQVGKSLTGCVIDAFHLTGDYPENWSGHKFEKAPVCWLLGYSGEKTRDLLQLKLFGEFESGKFAGGLVSADRILGFKSMTGTTGAMREVRVRHAGGGISYCKFWSYSQGQHALMGDVIDWYHIDEEPKDSEIFPQVLTRTLNGDQGRGGRGILTFTPENGKTQLVCSFMGEDEEGSAGLDSESRYLQTATWDDAPHLTDEMKKAILELYPPYQRAMRTKGVPLMGEGLIFPIDEETIKIPPFDIPDHWFVINGMDFGWDHPQAHVQIVYDRESDIIYIVNAWKCSKKQAFEAWQTVKPWAQYVPVAWPNDGLSTRNGIVQIGPYIDSGFNMLSERATWDGSSDSVDRGIGEMYNRMTTGRLKVVNVLSDWFEEMRNYHSVSKKTETTEKFKIVKKRDDLMDATRYAIMMLRYAVRIFDLNPQVQHTGKRRMDGRDKTTGY